jgi:heavy metal sensor kinase
MKPPGIRTKLTLFYCGVFFLLLALFAAFSYHILALRLDAALTEELAERAAALRGYLRFENGRPRLVYDSDEPDESFFIGVATRYYHVFDAKTGETLARSPELELMGVEYSPAEARTLVEGPVTTEVVTERGHLRFHNEVIRVKDGSSYLLQVGTSLQSKEDALKGYLESLLWMIPAAILLASAAGWWMAGFALRPVSALAGAAKTISASSLDRRLPLTGSGDELDHLTNVFNDTFGRLEQAMSEMKQFTAGLSHELRTPLAVLRGEAEVALSEARSIEDYREVLASQLEECDRLGRMINQLLMLARAEAGQEAILRETVELSRLTRFVAEQMEVVAAAKGIVLGTSIQDEIEVIGDAGWIQRVVLNLLDNSIKYTPSGGRVDVALTSEDAVACIEVRDTGIGIPRESLKRIFDRFYRVDAARSNEVEGAGLGLALVQWAVEQHAGTISVESMPNHGSCFAVRLPIRIKNI